VDTEDGSGVKIRDLIKLLEHDGWKLDRTKGSHRQYLHPKKPEGGTLTVAGHPSEDIPKRHFERYSETGRAKVMNEKYAVVFEKGESSFGAYVPDLPGCVAAASTRHEVEKLIAEAITVHIESLRDHGNPVPDPNSEVKYIRPVA
jgi:predicted RNase H-like HicB family nuclease/predicted RNA binding protein YcfA (HicA-like mRNA interferase family)